MKIAIVGYGRMGKRIEALAKASGDEIVSISTTKDPLTAEKLSSADCVIDFSNAESALSNIKLALQAKKPIVIGTTGWEKDMESAALLVKKENGALLASPNFSLGVLLFIELLKSAKELFSLVPDFDLAGIEYHHKTKLDAPSGTAKAISKTFDDAFTFSSVRVGTISGIHTVIADSETDTITLTHAAKNRDGFAKGALSAAKWLINKRGWFTLHDMVRTLHTAHHPVQ